MMICHTDITQKVLIHKYKSGDIILAGNKKLKIYGTLHCKSGKRMKSVNRVFFSNKEAAKNEGYRPCGRCMRVDYLKWKNGLI